MLLGNPLLLFILLAVFSRVRGLICHDCEYPPNPNFEPVCNCSTPPNPNDICAHDYDNPKKKARAAYDIMCTSIYIQEKQGIKLYRTINDFLPAYLDQLTVSNSCVWQDVVMDGPPNSESTFIRGCACNKDFCNGIPYDEGLPEWVRVTDPTVTVAVRNTTVKNASAYDRCGNGYQSVAALTVIVVAALSKDCRGYFF